MRRVLGWTSLVLLGLLGLVLMALFWITATERGLQVSLGWAERALPAMQVERARGSWMAGVALDHFQWGAEGSTTVSIDQLSVGFQWLNLFRGQLAIEALSAQRIEVALAPAADAASSSSGLPTVLLPFFLRADAVNVQTFSLQRAGQPLFETALTAQRLRWQGTTIHWRAASLQAEIPLPHERATFAAKTSGRITLRGDYPIRAEVDLQTYAAGAVSQINEQLRGVSEGRLALPDAFSATVAGSLATLEVSAQLPQPLALNLEAQLQLLTSQLPFQVALTQQAPLHVKVGGQALVLEKTDARLTGDLTQQELALSTQVGGLVLAEQTLAPATLQVQAALAEAELTVSSVRVDHPGLTLAGQCDVALANLAAACTGDLQRLSWPLQGGKPALTLGTSFSLSVASATGADDSLLRLRVPDLAGHWLQQAFTGKGDIALLRSGRWQVDDVRVDLGQNHLHAQGLLPDLSAGTPSSVAIAQTGHLQLGVQLSELGLLSPELAGEVAAEFSVSGSLAQPQLEGRASASDLRWPGGRLQALTLTAPALARSGRSQLQWQAQEAQVAGVQIATVSGSLTGDLAQHHLQLQVLQVKPTPTPGQVASAVALSNADLSCRGGWFAPAQEWQGSCDGLQGRVVLPEFSSAFQLLQPLKLVWQQAERTLVAAPACLELGTAQFCTPRTVTLGRKQQTLALQVKQLPLAWLLPPVPQLQYGGAINGDIALTRLQPLQLSADFAGSNVALTWVQAEGESNPIQPLIFESLSLNSTVTDQQVDVTLAGNASEVLDLSGKLTVTEPMTTRQLRGQLALNLKQLNTFAGFIEPVAALNGTGSLQAQLGGTLYQPELTGALQIAGTELQTDYFDEPVNTFQFDAAFTGMALTYEGEFAVSEGVGKVSGQGYWDSIADWYFKNQVNVSALAVKLPVGGTAIVDADLTMNAAPAQLEVRGQGVVREAHIQVDAIPPSRATVSADARVIGREETQQAWNQVIDVSLDLGDKFHFSGFGADLWLTGDLNYQQATEQLSRAKGKVVVSKGRYRAYGQRLNVRKGELIFNGPVDNPLLQMEVVRDTASSQVAGIRLTGTLQQPTTELFSEPSLSQTDTAYFLVSGQLRSESSSADVSNADAVLALGVSSAALGVGKFGAGKLAEQLGIDDFQISANQTDDGTEAQVSGYINPRLFVRYSTALDHKANTLTLQYRLNSRLVLESVTGFNRALDLLYTFTLD